MVGNHEVLADDVANGTEAPNPASHAVWTAWIAANGWDTHAGNGPTNAPPNADALNDDQSRMSYSFDDGDTHFVVLNTDTWTVSNELGWIALSWLEADLAAAQANANVARVFVFGHKPVVAPSGSTSAFEAVNAKLATKMIQALDGHAKVKGYFAAHAHQWSAKKLPGARGVYQIVAGNGGSMPDGSFKPGFYGFTEARIHASGAIGVVSHERPIPNPYHAGPATAAVPKAELVIAP
jgi:hypothetical protein